MVVPVLKYGATHQASKIIEERRRNQSAKCGVTSLYPAREAYEGRSGTVFDSAGIPHKHSLRCAVAVIRAKHCLIVSPS
jgi:hypothetical protein